MAASLPEGTDERLNAPVIGYGISAPTMNVGKYPATWDDTRAGIEPLPGGWYAPLNTAWWKFVAPEDAWVRFDVHQSTTSFQDWVDPGGEEWKPNTSLGIYIENRSGDLSISTRWGVSWFCLAGIGSSIKYDAAPYQSDYYGLPQWHSENTSELIVAVEAGRTYWIQVGVTDRYEDYNPSAVTSYVLTTHKMICHPHEIVVPAVGPFVRAPVDQYGFTEPIIVGGDDALRRDSDGYIDLPSANFGSRVSGFQQSLTGQPEWPPPGTARFPGYPDTTSIQIAFRYYTEPLPGYQAPSGVIGVEGDGGAWYSFSTTHYPDWRAPLVWHPDVMNDDGFLGDWIRDGGGSYVDGVYQSGPNDKSQGVVQGVFITDSDEFLSTGRTNTMPTDPHAWVRWYGEWALPPFYQPQYRPRPYRYDPMDYTTWGGAGSTLADGVQFAASSNGLRIRWFEWVVRWVIFEAAPDVPTEINGGPIGDGRAFVRRRVA